VIGSRDSDVEQRNRENGDRDSTFGSLTELTVGGKRSQYEADQRDDEAEAGHERKHRGCVVGQMDKAVVEAWRQTGEVGGHRDVADNPHQSLSPLPAEPAATDGRDSTRRLQAGTWSHRRSSSW